MTEKRASHPEVAILEKLYLRLVRKTGSDVRAGEYLRRVMKLAVFDNSDDLAEYERNPEEFFANQIVPMKAFFLMEKTESSEALSAELERLLLQQEARLLMFSPPETKEDRLLRLLPKIKDWSKDVPPHTSESRRNEKIASAFEDDDDIGPDRAFWQICRNANIHPLAEYLLSAEAVENLVIQLNDVEDPATARILIVEEAFFALWESHGVDLSNAPDGVQKKSAEDWMRRYLRCCRLLGGFITESKTHCESDLMLQYFLISDEQEARLKEQLETEELRRLD